MALKAQKELIVKEPRCFVVGVQQIHWQGLDAFLASEGHSAWRTTAKQASEILAEVAGRLCYMSFDGGRTHPDYIENIKSNKHGAVLEHAVISVILTGISRSLTHELVRHRAGWGYSQLSQRFVDLLNVQFVMPWAVRRVPGAAALWEQYVRAGLAAYEALRALLDKGGEDLVSNAAGHKRGHLATLLRKIVNGAARSLLPNATETKIFCTVNARALRHFIEMRCSGEADHEIREVALLIYKEARPFMPDILSDYEAGVDDMGVEYLTTKHTKV